VILLKLARNIISVFIITLLLLSISPNNVVSMTNREVVSINNIYLTEDFTGLSRPIFVNISSTGPIVLYQLHNESEGLGAFYKVSTNATITILYKVVNGVNGTIVELYGRDGNNFLNDSTAEKGLQLDYVTTVTENVTLDYYTPVKTLVDVSVSYYSVEITMNSDYFMFWAYVRDTLSPGSESEKGISNLLTTYGKFYSVAAESYFIQSENVTITAIGESISGNATYYLEWRENDTVTFNRIQINTGLTPTETGNFEVNVTLSRFDVGTGIEFRIRILHNDSVTGLEYEIYEPALHEIGIFDGSPHILLDTTTIYTKETQYNLSISTSVPKGQITNLLLNITGPNSKLETLPGNITFYIVDLAQEGIYNLTFTAITDKNLNATKSIEIVADRSLPYMKLTLAGSNEEVFGKTIKITSQDRVLEFNITAFDQGDAGVALIVINFGDNITKIYSQNGVYTYKYNEDGVYNVTVTVIDHAGNAVSNFFVVQVSTYIVNTDMVGMDPLTAFIISVSSLFIAFILNRRKQQ